MPASLRPTLTLRDLVFIVIGTVIGSGIFLVPSTVLRQTGGAVGLAMLVWVVAGALSLLGALTYGEMGAANPDAGGLYVYIRDAFGSLPAFLYGWTAFAVISSASVATLAVAFSTYLQQFVSLPPLGAKLVAVAMVGVVMTINIRGTRQGADVQVVSTAIKAGAILVMSVLLLVLGRGWSAPGVTMWPAAGSGSIISGVGLAMIAVLWAYEGWQYVTFSAGETIDAQRTFPRGIIIGTAIIIGIYLLANVAYIAALGAPAAAQAERVAAASVSATLGPAAGKIIAAVILVSMFSAANGITLTAPRMYYAMARDRVFFAKLAEVHPRFGTPALAIGISSVWAMVLAASGTFEQLLTYVVFTGWIFYALGALAIFVYRRRAPNAAATFRTPGYPLTPILFVLSAAAIVVNTVVSQPGRAAVGLGMVAIGIPLFYIWKGKGSGEQPAPVPAQG